jgi:phosphatidate cytidylyltransferase
MLLKRVVTALVLLVALLALLFWAPPQVAAMALFALLLVAGWEWSAFIRLDSVASRVAYAVAVAATTVAALWAVPRFLPLVSLLAVALAWWAAALAWISRYPTPMPRLAVAVAGVLVLVPACVALRAILVAGGGPALLLLVMVIVWAADIGAFFAGRSFGRIRLAPRVSPGKTLEGLAGGLVAAGGAAVLGALFLGLDPIAMAIAGTCVAGVSVVGDLAESMFKRQAGLKDSGSIFPGHGGVLDRIDSLTAALPAYALLLSWPGFAPAA